MPKNTHLKAIVLVKTSSNITNTHQYLHTGRTILNRFSSSLKHCLFASVLRTRQIFCLALNYEISILFRPFCPKTHRGPIFLNFRPLPNSVTEPYSYLEEHLNLLGRLLRSHTHLLHPTKKNLQYSYAHAAAITYIGMVSFRSVTQTPGKKELSSLKMIISRIANAHRNQLKSEISLE